MIIDIFSHILPPKYYAAVMKKVKNDPFISVPSVIDLDFRLKIMDELKDISQVISIVGPPLETLVKPSYMVELARIANNELANIVSRHSNKFLAAIALLPFNDIESTLAEIDRAITDLGMRGVQIYTDINGEPLDSPKYIPIFKKMEDYDLPIFLHPIVKPWAPDYPNEKGSRYNLFVTVGWPHATSMAMMRLAISGILEKFPNLKLITHHAGGTIPYLSARINNSPYKYPHLRNKVIDSLHKFYNDTAVRGDKANLMCAYDFFDAEHMVFGTDFPMAGSVDMVKDTIRSINEMEIPNSHKLKILTENAKYLLKITI
ncbi:MAG: amidohydrolase [Dehalococcoidales bacterium]|nr:amidohydrolase [Dehalococcoidales bacterium]